MVSGPRRFPVWVRRSVLMVCSWVWEARLSLLDLLRAVPGWVLEPQMPRSTSRSGVSPLAGLVVWGVAQGVRGCPLMWGNALLGGEQGTPGQQPKSARLCWPRGDTSPTSGFPTGQRHSQDSTRTAREASSSKN